VQRLYVDRRRRSLAPRLAAKYTGSPFQKLPAPLRDLVRMHVNCCASSASVFSLFTAANATFTLNAGL